MNMWAVALTHKLQMENGEDITKQHFGIHRQNHGGITPSFFMSGVTHGLYTYISIYIIISVQKTLYTVITSNHPANRLSLSLDVVLNGLDASSAISQKTTYLSACGLKPTLWS